MNKLLLDVQRYRAGHIDGEFTGFIPCLEHSKKILSKEITLNSLIHDRNEYLPKFPFAK